MPKETNNQIIKEEVTKVQIPLSFIRFFEKRGDERVLEVVIVYEGVDRWDTVIKPEGMRTDPKVVIVDYNHKGIATGAYVCNFRVIDEYNLSDGTILKRALIADLHIPRDAEMFYLEANGAKKSNGNLYDAVSKGQLPSVSVEFKPYKGRQTTDTRTGITTYHEWDLIYLSLLDKAPGQPYSGYKIIRSIKKNMNLNQIITTKLSEMEDPLSAENLVLTATFTVADKQYNAVVEVGESLEDVTITNVEMREGVGGKSNEDPEPTGEGIVDIPKNRINDEGYEEFRATIDELTKRMQDIETSLNKKQTEAKTKDENDDKEEEARLRSLVETYISQARKKVNPTAGDGQRQLGDEDDSSVQSFTPDDMHKAIRKIRLSKN